MNADNPAQFADIGGKDRVAAHLSGKLVGALKLRDVIGDRRFSAGELSANLEKRKLFSFRDVKALTFGHAEPCRQCCGADHEIIGKRTDVRQAIGFHPVSSKWI